MIIDLFCYSRILIGGKMLISICQSLVNVDRRSNQLLSSTSVASSISASSTPKINACIVLKFSESQTGNITITGTLDGSSQTEVISISSSKIAVGLKLFSSTTTIELDSDIVTGGGTVEAKFTGKDGGNVFTLTRVATSYPARISRGGANLAAPNSGSLQVEKPKALLPYTEVFEPQEGDQISLIQTSNKFIVVGSPFIEMVGFNTHWICNLERHETT